MIARPTGLPPNRSFTKSPEKYVIRLEPEDFEGKQLRKPASITLLDSEEPQKRFAPCLA